MTKSIICILGLDSRPEGKKKISKEEIIGKIVKI